MIDTPVTDTPVTDLLARAGAGDHRAWDELVRRYTPVIRGRMRSYRLQPADEQDITQTTWLKLAEHLGRLHTPEHLGGWLATVVSRECLLHMRRARRVTTTGDLIEVTLPSPEPGPEDLAIEGDAARRVREAVAALPPGRRKLIDVLFDDTRLSYAQVAQRVGMPVGGIGPTRARALRQLNGLVASRLADGG